LYSRHLTGQGIGVRRDPKNPDKKQKIFGYNLVLSTSVEIHLKIELPVAVTNIAGNAEEGSQIITSARLTSISLTQNTISPVTTDISEAKALFLSLTIIPGTKTYPNKPSLTEAMIKRVGLLLLVAS